MRQHVNDRLTATDRAVHARQPLITAEHQLVVELHAEVPEPFHRRTGKLGQPANDRWLDLPLVQLHVVVEQRLRVVLDAQRPLVARPGPHRETTGQAG